MNDTLVFHREHAVRGAAGHAAGERSENEAQHLDSSLPAGGKNPKYICVKWPTYGLNTDKEKKGTRR